MCAESDVHQPGTVAGGNCIVHVPSADSASGDLWRRLWFCFGHHDSACPRQPLYSPYERRPMIFDPSSAPHLKPWLVRTLEPMSVHSSSNFVRFLTAFSVQMRCGTWRFGGLHPRFAEAQCSGKSHEEGVDFAVGGVFGKWCVCGNPRSVV